MLPCSAALPSRLKRGPGIPSAALPAGPPVSSAPPLRNHSCPEAGTGPRWRWGSPCYPRGGLRAPQSAPTALPAEPTSSSPPADGNVGASPTHPASPSPFSLCCALQTRLRPMRRVIGPHRWHGCREITKTGRSKQTPAGGPAPACGTGPHLLSCKPCLGEVGR